MPWFEREKGITRFFPEEGSEEGAVVLDLVAELASAIPLRRHWAMEQMQEQGRTDLAPYLLYHLKSAEPGVRCDAVKTLGLTGYEISAQAGEVLIPMLYDSEAEVRLAVAVALWRLTRHEGVADLQRVLCADPSIDVRRAVARLLSDFEHPLQTVYFDYALTDPDSTVRAYAAVGLGLSRDSAFQHRVMRLLGSETEDVAKAGLLFSGWLLGSGSRTLETFLRMGHTTKLVPMLCRWLHQYLDRKPGMEAERELARVRTAIRKWPDAENLAQRMAMWQGDLLLRRAAEKASQGGSE